MIDIEEAIRIHRILVRRFGGAEGLRDYPVLSSALARPYQTFDGQELYPDALSKASALVESIVVNHPFFDGNKRLGYVLMRMLLMASGYDLVANRSDRYKFILLISQGKLKFDEIHEWIVRNTDQNLP